MAEEWTIQVSDDFLNDIANNLNTISKVTELAECEAVEMHSKDVYLELRIRAFEGIFSLLTMYLKNLDNQIQGLWAENKNQKH